MTRGSSGVTKQRIYELVESLPPEQLDAAEVLLEQLLSGQRMSVKEGRRIVRLGGLFKGFGVEITENDITKARREMWGRIGEEEE